MIHKDFIHPKELAEIPTKQVEFFKVNSPHDQYEKS